jgi:hypothetical protein
MVTLSVAACNSGNGNVQPSANVPDTKAPVVVSVVPPDGDTLATPTDPIVVHFNEAIADTAENRNAVLVQGPSGPLPGNGMVRGDVLSVQPQPPLAYNTPYVATLQAGVTDLAGNATTADYTWKFRTFENLCPSETLTGLTLIEGKQRPLNLPAIPKPPKGASYIDPLYGTCVTRVTDHYKEPPVGFARNDYSRREPFNADGSLMLIYAQDGYWHLYDARTYQWIRKLNLGGGSVEPQWHPTDPDLLYVIPNHGGLTMSTVNVENGARRTVADFRDVASIAGHPGVTDLTRIWPNAARVWTRSEGSPSRDARYWAFQVETSDFQPIGMISYDLKTNAITGIYDFDSDGGGIGRPDHVSISPLGDYVVASWNGPGVNCSSESALGSLHHPCGLMSFSRDFSSAVGLAVRGPHSDMALTADGHEVIVISDYDRGSVVMLRLDTGALTTLWNIYINGAATAMHFSGKNYAVPGWILISTYGLKDPQGALPWYSNKIMAVELKANPRILNIANIVNSADHYFSEPQAAVNGSFTRILFNSNWGTGKDTDVDAYMITLPGGAIPASP